MIDHLVTFYLVLFVRMTYFEFQEVQGIPSHATTLIGKVGVEVVNLLETWVSILHE